MNAFSILAFLAATFSLSACGQQPGATSKVHAKMATQAVVQATAAKPVVVELYQSQGCSSCPPANAAVNAVVDQPGVIALSFAVTYWDRLGWKDIFGDKAYTQRQYDYAHALGNAYVATPQIIINGKTAITGIRQGELARSITASSPVAKGPAIDLEKDHVKIGKGTGPANVWLVRYDPRTQNVAIRSGENTGRTLPHKNVVRSLIKLGEWRGTAAKFTLPATSTSQLKSVILVQRTGAGPIVAAKII